MGCYRVYRDVGFEVKRYRMSQTSPSQKTGFKYSVSDKFERFFNIDIKLNVFDADYA